MTFKTIDADTRDCLFKSINKAVGSLKAMSTENPEEVAVALELIGARLRREANLGFLMFAKIILDHANTKSGQ